MNWIIVCVINIVLSVVFALIDRNRPCDIWPVICSAICAFAAIILLLIIPLETISNKRDTNKFSEQKAYIETHEANTAVEDAAMTAKKVELNEWLYKAQWSRENFGNWCFYPVDVLDMEPIQ